MAYKGCTLEFAINRTFFNAAEVVLVQGKKRVFQRSKGSVKGCLRKNNWRWIRRPKPDGISTALQPGREIKKWIHEIPRQESSRDCFSAVLDGRCAKFTGS